MALPLYLAMTAAEVHQSPQLPQHPAWMACHFSPYSTGLSNFPQALPPESMLILNDRTPIAGHDGQLIANQLSDLIEQIQISSVLLDFQRPDAPETAQLVSTLTSALACPVGVSDIYAKEGTFAVFLPPPPPNLPLEEYLAPWQGREIWLEAALDNLCITVTDTGATFSHQDSPSQNPVHYDETLLCHYQTELDTNCVRFCLHRTQTDLENLLVQANALGVTCAIGLYQELNNFHINTP